MCVRNTTQIQHNHSETQHALFFLPFLQDLSKWFPLSPLSSPCLGFPSSVSSPSSCCHLPLSSLIYFLKTYRPSVLTSPSCFSPTCSSTNLCNQVISNAHSSFARRLTTSNHLWLQHVVQHSSANSLSKIKKMWCDVAGRRQRKEEGERRERRETGEGGEG